MSKKIFPVPVRTKAQKVTGLSELNWADGLARGDSNNNARALLRLINFRFIEQANAEWDGNRKLRSITLETPFGTVTLEPAKVAPFQIRH